MNDTKTNTVRVIIFCVFIAIIIIVMSMIAGGTSSVSNKLDSFAQCLTQKKLKFYGAFWCPHCQAQKAAFGGSAEYLPYIECSNADRSQTQVCNDAKIESYPTWVYPTTVSYTSEIKPTVCSIQPGPANQNPVCEQAGSHYFKTYIFSDIKFQSEIDPIISGNVYTFPAGSRTVGELDTQAGLQNLANFSNCTLPSSTSTQ